MASGSAAALVFSRTGFAAATGEVLMVAARTVAAFGVTAMVFCGTTAGFASGGGVAGATTVVETVAGETIGSGGGTGLGTTMEGVLGGVGIDDRKAAAVGSDTVA